MSINLVSLVSQYLTPAVIGRIAGALGVDRTLVGKAATYLAPVLLRMLAGVAATPAGAQRLAETIEHQDPSILENLDSVIGGTGQHSFVKEGVTALESLLGGSGVSALGGALGKFTGLGQGAVSSLIGTLTPVVLGTLGKVQSTEGLDASGLSRLLQSQKENISAAIPAELGDLLGKAGAPAGARAGEVERPAFRQAERPPVVRATPPEDAPSSFNWRLVLPAVAALGLLSWWFLGNRPAEVEQTKNTANQVVRNLTVDGVDLKSSAQTAFDGLKTALLGVKDTTTAQAALPQLEKGSIEFDKLRDLAGKLPIDAKTAFATVVASLRPSIEELFNKVLEIPGVAPIAKPAINGLRARLDALSRAES
jgi:hypothetical protein